MSSKNDDSKIAAMTAKSDDDIEVIRVRPYPIACQLLKGEGTAPLPAKIMKLVEQGFITKSVGHFFRVGDSYTVQFQIPAFKVIVRENVKVIKNYESLEAYIPGGNKEQVLTVEFHFKSLAEDKKAAIKKFLMAIGQLKRTS